MELPRNSISGFNTGAVLAELARDSQGPEAETGGLIGPVELSNPHPAIAQMLSISKPSHLWPLGVWENGW